MAAVVDFVKQNSGDASYDDQVMQEIEQHAAEKEKGAKGVGGSAPEEVGEEFDELIDAAAEVILETGTGVGLYAPAPAEAGLCPGGPSGGPDGGEGDRGYGPIRWVAAGYQEDNSFFI